MSAAKLLELMEGHWGKFLGVILGLVFGLFTVKFGFLQALFIAGMIAVGYYIGRQLDESTDWREFWERLRRGK